MIAQTPTEYASTMSPSNNENSNQSDYKLLPIERKSLNDKFLLKRLNRNVQFEVAKIEDAPQIHKFLLNEFGEQEPLNKALGMKRDDLYEPLKNAVNEAIPQEMTILIVDQGYLCGVVINSICQINRDLVKKPQIQPDYENELETKTDGISPRLRKIYTILGEIQCFTPNFLPNNCSKYVSIDIISILPHYAGCGLGKAILVESFKLAHKNGIDFVEATCTATASAKICESLGMKLVFEFPYSEYKYYGKAVFEEATMHDGCQSAQLMIGNLDEIVKKL